ncbi:hypothetical protein H5201_08205 [Pseudoalteromonas sp. SG43-6]|uniref:hypothetical protein n=1 Tax=Pseudoalteromonas sp. SG43-6 TaxID=2760967 RepID=UPI0016032737|nr:hypothetical protein [Pseudoalteromonas sp. SG43-6]MBB1434289.1 hypothetical protein [Pseudoalteromonas sp. SG43-6]
MNLVAIEGFSSVKDVLSEPLKKLILAKSEEGGYAKLSNVILNIYATFVDTQCLSVKHVINYSAIDVLNDEKTFQNHFYLLIGFVYEEFNEFSNARKYTITLKIGKLFSSIALDLSFHTFNPSVVLQNKISKDAMSCIERYKASPQNIDKIKLFCGWNVTSKFGDMYFIHLETIHATYGPTFTNEVLLAIQNYGAKQKSTSLYRIIGNIMPLLNTIARLYPSEVRIREALSEKQSNKTFLAVLGCMIADQRLAGNSIENFLNTVWTQAINVYMKIFVDTNFFGLPQFEIVKPKYKVQPKSSFSVSTGGGLNIKNTQKLLSGIPLSISDSEAIEAIASRINRDIEHIKLVALNRVEELVSRRKRNKVFINEGVVRNFPACNSGTSAPVGVDNLPNIVATFEHYKWSKPLHNFPMTLQAPADFLVRELNIPTSTNILCFLTLLIIEHPQITPSWIANWELFNRDGKKVGFVQVGSQYAIVSCKMRKGVNNAEQILILNDRSISIVKNLIEYTDIARQWLKRQGDDNWRFMCLHCLSIGSKPTTIAYGNRKKIQPLPQFYALFDQASLNKKGEVILSKEEANDLACNINLRPIRSSRALQVYFETYSVVAMSEALGHKQLKPDLLSSYLPDVILEYFNNRWIRIFQNAVICKAMKHSPYLSNAADLSVNELDTFMTNHGIGDLPEHLYKGKQVATSINAEPDEIKGDFDKLVIPFSIPLIQVLTAIITVVESSTEEVSDFFIKWYESACFLIKQLEISVGEKASFVSKEIESLYKEAKANPLCPFKFKDALCH